MNGLGKFWVLLLLLFGGFFTLIVFADKKACEDTGEVMGVRVEWRITAGCFAERNGKMIPLARWLVLEGVE